jgi:hypothetical protein
MPRCLQRRDENTPQNLQERAMPANKKTIAGMTRSYRSIHGGEISTLSRSFFNWSRNAAACSNSRFFAALSFSFSSRVLDLKSRIVTSNLWKQFCSY